MFIQTTPIEMALNRIDQRSSAAVTMVKNAIAEGFVDMWQSKDYTAQDMCDRLGTNASKLFIAFAAAQAFVKAVDPTYEPIASTQSVKINLDGTVTINSQESGSTPGEVQ